ncbi:hypothetical protein DIPPA_21803 [Diplonema papillatum]|nr:hypothetical protein DIPPA_21803 [Diplonema papillatum]
MPARKGTKASVKRKKYGGGPGEKSVGKMSLRRRVKLQGPAVRTAAHTAKKKTPWEKAANRKRNSDAKLPANEKELAVGDDKEPRSFRKVVAWMEADRAAKEELKAQKKDEKAKLRIQKRLQEEEQQQQQQQPGSEKRKAAAAAAEPEGGAAPAAKKVRIVRKVVKKVVKRAPADAAAAAASAAAPRALGDMPTGCSRGSFARVQRTGKQAKAATPVDASSEDEGTEGGPKTPKDWCDLPRDTPRFGEQVQAPPSFARVPKEKMALMPQHMKKRKMRELLERVNAGGPAEQPRVPLAPAGQRLRSQVIGDVEAEETDLEFYALQMAAREQYAKYKERRGKQKLQEQVGAQKPLSRAARRKANASDQSVAINDFV